MKSKFDFKTGDIIRIPMYQGLFIITDDNTNLGGYGPGSVEIRAFPPGRVIDDSPFYRLPKHFKELKIEKVS